MENASKALIMAAEVLIAVVILSLAVYLIITFGSYSADVHKKNEEVELQRFNTQFTKFESIDNITIYDVITVANYAKENNMKYELDTSINSSFDVNKYRNNENTMYVTVCKKMKGEDGETITWIEDKKQSDYDDLIKADYKNMDRDDPKLPFYKCKTYISNITGRVYKVVFEKQI